MSGQEIAVIGMAGRFPGAQSIDAFWQNLKEGVESLRAIPETELLARGVSATELADPAYVRRAAVLDGIDQFDAGFFGFSPRDAAILDPQHRQFLECAWEAIEHAGHNPELFPGAIGVYAGSGMNSYLIYNLLTNPELVKSAGLFLLRQTGNDKDVLATRVSYQLNLRGPSINIQTACSTSLVAIHLACQSLLNHECDMALAGGVTVELPHGVGYTYREGEILSQDGHCRSFDASSTGTVFGSGLGIVVLRRLSDAIEDGDHIHAVVLGSAINNDGSRKVGYLAPSVEGQAEVITEALTVADVDARSISYVETHGTGTRVGDPIEIEALTQAFRGYTKESQFCAIGSVKSNIGHLDTAAGVTGFIKTVLALKHGQIPASLHFEKPNPHIDFVKSPFYVNTHLRDWKSESSPRRAAVTSLGIGGTNAHAVLEEAPRLRRPKKHREWQVLTLSAKSETALDRVAERLASYLQEHPELDIADVSFTCQLGRKAFSRRRALVCRNLLEAVDALRGKPRQASAWKVDREDPEVVFLFSGQGSQYVNMGRDLYRDEPMFRQEIDLCVNLLQPHIGLDLRTILYPSGGPEENGDQLSQTWLTQPALFAVEYALAKLLMSWGITPRAMVGHSIGEYVAACLAGVFTLEAALEIVAGRGRLMQSVPTGAMIAVLVPEQELLPLLPVGISIAATNGPQQCVASGAMDAIEELVRELDKREIPFRRLHTSHAFHSQMTEPILGSFEEIVKRFSANPPTIPYLSNVTGTWITPADVQNPEYWKRHLRGTVRFSDALEELFRKPGRVLLEVGPGQTLSTLARQHPNKGTNQRVLQSMRHRNEAGSDMQVLLTALGQLWSSGAHVEWNAFRAQDRGYRTPLPAYPFEHQRYWIEPGEHTRTASASEAAAPKTAQWFYRQTWKLLPHERHDAATNLKWLILGTNSLGRSIANRLRHSGNDVTVVMPGDKFSAGRSKYTIRPNAPEDYKRLVAGLVAKGNVPARIIHLWALETLSGADSIEARQSGSFYSLLHLAQALGEQDLTGIELAAISDRMQSIAGEPVLHAESATVLGPCQVIPKEYSGISCCSIDVSLAEQDYDRIAQQIIDEVTAGTSSTPVRALRGVDRWGELFQPVTLAPASGNSRLRQRGVYLITGGLGGVGLKIASRLAKEIHARLVLTGRSQFPPREEWERLLRSVPAEPFSRQILAILEMEKAGAEVHIVRANVADLQEMRDAIAQARNRFGALHGVIHAAGILDDGPIQFKTRERAFAVLEPKLKGTLVLDELLKDTNVDFLALFSSISSVVAPAGQVDYAAANAFLDAFARSRQANGNPVTIAINWPLWRDIGMGAASPKSLPLAQRHPLLDARIADRSKARVYSATLSCRTHWILNDHRFREGKALFPGTGYLEMAIAGLGSAAEERPVELRDVFFVAPFTCDPDAARDVRLAVEDRDQAASRFSISSRIAETAEWQEYAVGTGAQPERARPDPVSVQQILARCDVREIDFQGQLTKQEKYFFFGPRWRSLQRIHVGKNEGVSVVELPTEFYGDLQEYRIHPALLDIATGSALYLIRDYEAADDLYLPVGYKRITVWGRLPGKVYSHIRVSGENTGSREVSTFDTLIVDQAGVPLIEIEGFAMRRVIAQQLQAVRDGTYTNAATMSSRSLTDPKEQEGISAAEGENALLQILSNPDIGGRMIFSPSNPNLAGKAPERNARALPASPSEGSSGSTPNAAGDSKDEIEQALAGWWQDLLGTSRPDVNADFFELGGHSLVAVQLFVKIKKTYRVDLDLRILFEARTIAKLADAIRAEINPRDEHQTAAPRYWSSLVPIHPSGDLPPIYFVSGAGGHVLIFEHLANYLGPEQPVYALQPPGLDGKQSFLTRLEDIAAHYLREIKTVQPHGPYYLAGYSFGGIVTFEMAQQLAANGDQVGLLVLLDTTWRYWDKTKPPSTFAGTVRHYAKRTADLLSNPAKLVNVIGNRTHTALRKVFRAVGRPLPLGDVEDANWFAVTNYVAKPYPGRVTLIRCSERPGHKDDLFGWRNLSAGVDVKDTPGNHMTIVKEPNVRYLGQTLRQCMKEAAANTTEQAVRPTQR